MEDKLYLLCQLMTDFANICKTSSPQTYIKLFLGVLEIAAPEKKKKANDTSLLREVLFKYLYNNSLVITCSQFIEAIQYLHENVATLGRDQSGNERDNQPLFEKLDSDAFSYLLSYLNCQELMSLQTVSIRFLKQSRICMQNTIKRMSRDGNPFVLYVNRDNLSSIRSYEFGLWPYYYCTHVQLYDVVMDECLIHFCASFETCIPNLQWLSVDCSQTRTNATLTSMTLTFLQQKLQCLRINGSAQGVAQHLLFPSNNFSWTSLRCLILFGSINLYLFQRLQKCTSLTCYELNAPFYTYETDYTDIGSFEHVKDIILRSSYLPVTPEFCLLHSRVQKLHLLSRYHVPPDRLLLVNKHVKFFGEIVDIKIVNCWNLKWVLPLLGSSFPHKTLKKASVTFESVMNWDDFDGVANAKNFVTYFMTRMAQIDRLELEFFDETQFMASLVTNWIRNNPKRRPKLTILHTTW
ncbi:hypothetical protein RFI_33105 [Reticulomyxa filosa]|uniref:F-box domain-containing protein n=1 Tax=Reticulomyxa filosa TaxID=46433 RepID=X6LU85_RETFI|nr:hypothetical protein RFI_33105 [Reticulomyxa filosa]|eukprot:ETO04290.1 hypothetical protein RFI_33105 [Reticulomyxa filosa]